MSLPQGRADNGVATTKSAFKVAWNAYKLTHPGIFACTLRASGITAYDLKTDAHSLGTCKYSLGT